MQRAKRLSLPRRILKRTTITLPVDQLELLDECAKAVGQDRGGFMTLFIDGFWDEIAAFAKGYVGRVLEQAKKAEVNHSAEGVENVQTDQARAKQ
jgi:hypothetical protein